MDLSFFPPLFAFASTEAAGAVEAGTQAVSNPWPQPLRTLCQYLYIYGNPQLTFSGDLRVLGNVASWITTLGLFSLLGWFGYLIVGSFQQRRKAALDALDYVALTALIGVLGTIFYQVYLTTQMEATSTEIPTISGLNIPVTLGLFLLFGTFVFVWVERAIWTSAVSQESKFDRNLLILTHVLAPIGPTLAVLLPSFISMSYLNESPPLTRVAEAGFSVSATYMGTAILLSLLGKLLGEFAKLRGRRLYSIAWLTVAESNRRMRALWIMLAVFGVLLLFTDWFLVPTRAAETGSLYTGTIAFTCSLLIMSMVIFLTPLSLPNDIQNQTIYTVVSKPVSRLELVWGRIFGFMGLITLLLVIFGIVSALYVVRNVQIQKDRLAEQQAEAEELNNERLVERAKFSLLQLEKRMSARQRIDGILTFIDSRGQPQPIGIDVGSELRTRSHIEGATQSAAIWQFAPKIRDPLDGRRVLNRRVPVEDLLRPGSIEALLNRQLLLAFQNREAERARAAANLTAERSQELVRGIQENDQEIEQLQGQIDQLKRQEDELQEQLTEARQSGDGGAQDRIQRQINRLHSPPIPLEMTFNVYRTTKGDLGKPVYASLDVVNELTDTRERVVFPVREYYTNELFIPAEVLAGSNGQLRVVVRCLTPQQYLGMAAEDLYFVYSEGDYFINFMKGMIGVWLQALVLTTIAVFAGTFLRWPVALLTTIMFFIAGQVAFAFLVGFANPTMEGGGPFEALIRLLNGSNQMENLGDSLPVLTAKSLDTIVRPVMSRLVYLVPNLNAFDYSNRVASGYAVTWSELLGTGLLALGYFLPFSIAAYLILKRREVAA